MFPKIRFFIFAFLFYVLGAVSVAFIPRVQALTDVIYKELDVFTRIIEIIDQQYVTTVDDKKLVEGAIRGMLSSLDPYTFYMPAETYKDFKSDTTGKFGGVGLEVSLKDGILTVLSPIEDSPAYRGGLKPGDKILKIDGKPTKTMSLIDAVQTMRGPKGKKVVLTIWREGMDKSKDVVLVREIIQSSPVKTENLGDGYVYARLTVFQERTADLLQKALDQLKAENGGNLRGILLDLRDDPGGLLSEAVFVSDLFMTAGPVVSTRGRTGEIEIRSAQTGEDFETVPVVVLINHGSASASEIVAGALQDTKRAKVAGIQSFGKGSVQTVVDMGEGTALKLTIARYYTPKGRMIDGEGIEPDIILNGATLEKDYAKVDAKDRPTLADYQKDKALEILKKM